MKNLMNHARRSLVAGAIICLPLGSILAADTNSSPAQPPPVPGGAAPGLQAPTSSPAPTLPYGVADVLKLSQAQVSEDVVLNYIQNSGTIYNLGPREIVFLRSQGVSDRVVNAMLDQKRKVTETAAAAAPNPGPTPVLSAPAAPDYSQVAPQPAPAPSTVYTIPPPTVSYPYYNYYYSYPYYAPYGYYYPSYYGGYYRGPVVSFGFRFGGGHYRGGWHRH